ncbi:MAG: hypothetical protein NXH73_06395 [Flavobacteriaceae bacterium]|nr:hypothetical protein [Flavobacteriaceae bacterium]
MLYILMFYTIMKKTYFIILTLILFTGCGLQNKQQRPELVSHYTQEDLKEMAHWKYGFDLEKKSFCDLYLIDGLPFDENGIDTILSKFRKSDIQYIVTVERDDNPIWFHQNCDLLTLIRTQNQPNKEKKEILEEVRSIFNRQVNKKTFDYKCEDCPLMSVNGTLIQNPLEQKRIINELSVRKIQNIVKIRQPLNLDTFGAKGKNGIVEITTK